MDEVRAPAPAQNPAARFDRLGSVLALVTVVVGVVALLGGSEATRRGDIALLVIALAALTGGVGLLIAFATVITRRPGCGY